MNTFKEFLETILSKYLESNIFIVIVMQIIIFAFLIFAVYQLALKTNQWLKSKSSKCSENIKCPDTDETKKGFRCNVCRWTSSVLIWILEPLKEFDSAKGANQFFMVVYFGLAMVSFFLESIVKEGSLFQKISLSCLWSFFIAYLTTKMPVLLTDYDDLEKHKERMIITFLAILLFILLIVFGTSNIFSVLFLIFLGYSFFYRTMFYVMTEVKGDATKQLDDQRKQKENYKRRVSRV